MSESFQNDPWVILIMLANYALLLTIFFLQRKYGRKNHRYDERYYHVNNRNKARSWDAMLVIMLIAWPIVIIFDGISFSFFLLTIIYVLHNVTLLIVTAYYSNKNEEN
ncbi:hypothetical protein [Ornithinibacillus halophilus]|uniref:hypothetical protein n=1 Tax=Ornithinibacillus halophilus TaxID=930117 RepID=UPI0011607057|nr:hypothetical protein [Ornithinibacillus halophilus]